MRIIALLFVVFIMSGCTTIEVHDRTADFAGQRFVLNSDCILVEEKTSLRSAPRNWYCHNPMLVIGHTLRIYPMDALIISPDTISFKIIKVLPRGTGFSTDKVIHFYEFRPILVPLFWTMINISIDNHINVDALPLSDVMIDDSNSISPFLDIYALTDDGRGSSTNQDPLPYIYMSALDVPSMFPPKSGDRSMITYLANEFTTLKDLVVVEFEYESRSVFRAFFTEDFEDRTLQPIAALKSKTFIPKGTAFKAYYRKGRKSINANNLFLDFPQLKDVEIGQNFIAPGGFKKLITLPFNPDFAQISKAKAD